MVALVAHMLTRIRKRPVEAREILENSGHVLDGFKTSIFPGGSGGSGDASRERKGPSDSFLKTS